jgi:hypothetical protein
MANMDDEIYISVALDDYLELRELKDFLEILVDYGLKDWEHFDEAVEDFLEDDDSRDDPREFL